MSPGESRARVRGWVPSAGQVSLSVYVGWGDTAFDATRGYGRCEVLGSVRPPDSSAYSSSKEDQMILA